MEPNGPTLAVNGVNPTRERARRRLGAAITSLGEFLGELKRRHVFRVAVAYAAGTWLALEVAATLTPELGLPENLVRWITAAALLGLAPVLALAWAFDLTREGLRRTESTPHAGSPEAELGATGDLRRMVALPFIDRSPEGDHRYLGDGITEELISALARLRGLRVVSRTTAFSLAAEGADVREIGARLGVGSVLEGSLRVMGDRLRLTVQLVGARDGLALWSRTFDRRIRDVFAVQEEIARSIVEALRRELAIRGDRDALGPDEAGGLVPRSTSDSEAYTLYLRGRARWNERTAPALREAIDLFEQAAARDPKFAHAHAGLADAWSILLDYGVVAPAEGLPRALRAAERALRTGPELAEAHTAAALVRQMEWDWVGADTGFRAALERAPGHVVARHRRALLLAWLGRASEARSEIARARELDPLSPVVQASAGWIEYYGGDPAAAAEAARATLAAHPDFVPARALLGVALLVSGRTEEALPELERAAAVRASASESEPTEGATAESTEGSLNLALLVHGLGRAGRVQDARAGLARLRRRARIGYVSPYHLAIALLGGGREEDALTELERAAAERSPQLVTLPTEPLLAPLGDRPSFRRIVTRTGLPSGGGAAPGRSERSGRVPTTPAQGAR